MGIGSSFLPSIHNMWWAKLLFFLIGINSAEEHIYGVTCGRFPKPRVVNGEKANLTDIGYQVYFRMAGGYQCGGSIIGKKHILTAAHCTDGMVLDGSFIIAGDETKGDDNFSDGQHYEIAKVIQHPDYTGVQWPTADGDPLSFMRHDISILELSTEIQFNEKVYPICLPSSDFCLKNGQKLLVSGWGVTEDESLSKDLLQAEVELLNVCLYGEHDDVHKICAQGMDEPVTDTCQGDSGGPLAYFDSDGVATNYGVVSYGPQECATKNNPGIYVRVSEYVEWINEVSGVFMRGEECREKTEDCGDDVERLGWTDNDENASDSCGVEDNLTDPDGFWHPLDLPDFCVRAKKPEEYAKLYLKECREEGLEEKKYKNWIWDTIPLVDGEMMVKLRMSELYHWDQKSLCVEGHHANNRPLFLNECNRTNTEQRWSYEHGVLFLKIDPDYNADSARCAYFKKNGTLKIFDWCDNFYFGFEE